MGKGGNMTKVASGPSKGTDESKKAQRSAYAARKNKMNELEGGLKEAEGQIALLKQLNEEKEKKISALQVYVGELRATNRRLAKKVQKLVEK
jgi:SMC interacting uncharacterized protein involved in chromosome segregation